MSTAAVTTETTAAVSPAVLTAAEAAAALKLPNVRSWNRRRRAAGVTGMRAGAGRLYAREQVERVRRHMFGLER